MKNNKEKGFTLIELLVVISIISLLTSIVLATLSDARMKARDARRMMDLKQIQNALELYRSNNSSYPNNTDEQDPDQAYSIPSYWVNSSGVFANSLKPYISKLPIDPTNNDVSGFGKGAHFYWYHRYSNGYLLCAALEKPKSTQNPLASIPGYSALGDSAHMYNGGYCLNQI